jgi:hypothetical protein
MQQACRKPGMAFLPARQRGGPVFETFRQRKTHTLSIPCGRRRFCCGPENQINQLTRLPREEAHARHQT